MAFQKKAKKDVNSDSSLDLDLDPNKTYLFLLNGNATPSVYTLPKHTEVWDDELQKLRTIRYSKTEKSPYVDEQNSGASMESSDIQFIKGRLPVDGKHTSLIKYLMAFDGFDEKETINPSNERFRKLYRLHREDLVVKASRERRDKVLKASNIVNEANIDELTDFLRSSFRFNPEQAEVENKEDLIIDKALEYATEYPDKFITDFKNPKHQYKSAVQRGFEQGVLTATKDTIKWLDTDAAICKYDQSKGRADEVIAGWILATKEGKQFYEELTVKLN